MAAALSLILALAAAAPLPSIEAIRVWQARTVRIHEIAWRLQSRNAAHCPVTRMGYGFTSIYLQEDTPPEMRQRWADALQIEGLATIAMVGSDSPAAASDVRPGDSVLAVNGTRWGKTAAEQTPFLKALNERNFLPRLTMSLKRGDRMIDVALDARKVCAGDVFLINSRKANASASGTNIAVDSGLETLLTSDDELAFVIAHEFAHISLGHSSADQAKAVKDRSQRFAMEKAADALGIRWVLRAGYAPEVAAQAHPKIVKANRGPISGLLGLHGPYMAPKARAAFLAQEAAAARREATAE
jgi:hypothetical protein